MKTLHINYTPDGNPISDHMVESTILKKVFEEDGDEILMEVSTENVIICSRYLKLTNILKCNLKLSYNGVELPLGEHYEPVDWGSVYPRYHEKWVIGIINEQLIRKNAK